MSGNILTFPKIEPTSFSGIENHIINVKSENQDSTLPSILTTPTTQTTRNNEEKEEQQNEVSLEMRHNALKRKFNDLVSENYLYAQQLEVYKRLVKKLKAEKSFLVDKLARATLTSYNGQVAQSNSNNNNGNNNNSNNISNNNNIINSTLNNSPSEGGDFGSSPLTSPNFIDSSDEMRKRRRLPGTSTRPRRDPNAPIQLCTALRKDGSQCKSKAILGTKFCWHHASMGNASIGICQYRNASSSKKCNIPISKESVTEGIMLCNFHRRKMATSSESPNIQINAGITGMMSSNDNKLLIEQTGNEAMEGKIMPGSCDNQDDDFDQDDDMDDDELQVFDED